MNLLGAAAFLNCWMDEHIHPEGWTWMHYRVPDGPDGRLEPGDARLFESSNHGPGARINPSRRQLPQSGMRDYGRAAMFGDWRP
jgi:pectinesterase